MRRNLIRWLAAFGALALFPAMAMAIDLDGWCFPANDCTGAPMPIRDNAFNTCEEVCTLSSPTSVRGMSGTLYDVRCTSDGGGNSSQRMFFLGYKKADSTTGLLAVSNNGAVDLAKCE